MLFEQGQWLGGSTTPSLTSSSNGCRQTTGNCMWMRISAIPGDLLPLTVCCPLPSGAPYPLLPLTLCCLLPSALLLLYSFKFLLCAIVNGCLLPTAASCPLLCLPFAASYQLLCLPSAACYLPTAASPTRWRSGMDRAFGLS